MTKEEFNKIEWTKYCHSTGGGYYETVYKAEGFDSLYKYCIVPHDEAMTPRGHMRTIYEYNDKEYNTVTKLLEAI